MDFPVPKSEVRRLRRLAEARFQDSADKSRLDALCTAARDHFGVDISAITLLTREDQLLLGRDGVDVARTPRDIAFCNYTILHHEVFVVEDTRADDRFRTHPMTLSEPFVRFYAGAPLVYDTDDHLGAFCLLHPTPKTFSMGDRAELLDFAEQAMSILIGGLFPGRG